MLVSQIEVSQSNPARHGVWSGSIPERRRAGRDGERQVRNLLGSFQGEIGGNTGIVDYELDASILSFVNGVSVHVEELASD